MCVINRLKYSNFIECHTCALVGERDMALIRDMDIENRETAKGRSVYGSWIVRIELYDKKPKKFLIIPIPDVGTFRRYRNRKTTIFHSESSGIFFFFWTLEKTKIHNHITYHWSHTLMARVLKMACWPNDNGTQKKKIYKY